MSLHPLASDALQTASSVLTGARNNEEVEVFVQDVTSTKIGVFGGEVESLNSARTRGLGIRLIADGRLGYAYTSDLSAEAIDNTLNEARENAIASTPDEANVFPDPSPAGVVEIFDPSAEQVSTSDKIEITLDLEARILKGESIERVRSVKFTDAISHTAIVSTLGVEGAWSKSSSVCSGQAIAEAGHEQQTGLGLSMSLNPTTLDVEAAASEAILRSVRMLGAKKVPTARVPVVFDPHAAVSLLAVLGVVASAEAVIKGRSLFAGRLDESIGSDLVTIVDDGLLPEGLSSSPFDSEGVPRQTTSVVENGIAKSYLHNAWSGRRLGTSSTGNTSRISFKTPPGIAPSNFYMKPGERTQDDLLGEVQEGLYVQELIGVHSGVNTISGDFSVGASGLWISGGSLGQPVREVTVASTVFDLFRGVVAVGSDFRLFPGFLTLGAYGSASLLIDGVTVAGV